MGHGQMTILEPAGGGCGRRAAFRTLRRMSAATVRRAATLSVAAFFAFAPLYGLIWNLASSNLKSQEQEEGGHGAQQFRTTGHHLCEKAQQLCHDDHTEISQTVPVFRNREDADLYAGHYREAGSQLMNFHISK